ncbi:MAG: hypothetical protein NBKEAIPA_02831 [Nitrospirae bacterium]|nr:hypothetical protein [Nitrospirota bacterium]
MGAVSFQRIGGQGNDGHAGRRRGGLFPFSNQAGGGKAIHLRHLTIHEDYIEPPSRRRFHGKPAMFGIRDGAAQQFQHVGGHLTVDGVVFDQEDMDVESPGWRGRLDRRLRVRLKASAEQLCQAVDEQG